MAEKPLGFATVQVLHAIAGGFAYGFDICDHTSLPSGTVYPALSRLEQRLDPQKFTRVHRAHIVNLDHVRAFRPDDRGGLEAELTDGTRVPVSRARAQELRSAGR